MKSLQLHEMENIVGGKMFGSVTTCIDGPADANGNISSCEVQTTTYFFWFAFDGDGGDDGPKYGSCASNGY